MNDVTTEQERRAQIARLSGPAKGQTWQVLVTIEAEHGWFTPRAIRALGEEMCDTIYRCVAEPDKVRASAKVV